MDEAGTILCLSKTADRLVDKGASLESSRPWFKWSHTCDLKIGTLVATLPSPSHYKVSAGHGWLGVTRL